MPSDPVPPDPSQPDKLRESVKDVVREILTDPLHPVLDDFKASIPGYLEVAPFTLPIGQVTGFSKFLANYAISDATGQSTSSASYVSLTGDPQLTGLGDGEYVILFGCQGQAGTARARMSISVNGAAASDDDACVSVIASNPHSISIAIVKSLSNSGVNTVIPQYLSEGGTATFVRRWLLAIKYSNL